MPINATFHGFIETTTDSLLLFEACHRGVLPKISRRLQERERGSVKSGTVFVFDEKESGIKRWTDGLIWSPSRILGNFLIYRELGGRESLNEKGSNHDMSSNQYLHNQYSNNNHYMPQNHHLLYEENTQESVDDDDYEDMTIEERNRERNLVGSLTDTYKFRKGGLIKKTLSIQLNGCTQHLISYYTKEDVLKCRLSTPSSISELSCLQISPELLLKQSFRVPPSVEFAELMLKRPSLSPSSTTSSSTSHSTTTVTHNVKRISPNNMTSHPYATPFIQKDQDEDDDHSLYHSRRLAFEAPSDSRKSARTSIDSTSGNSRRSSCLNYPSDNSNYGMPPIMNATNEVCTPRYSEGRDINNSSKNGFRSSSDRNTAVAVYETGSYQNVNNTPQPSTANSAFVSAVNYNKDINQQQRRHSNNSNSKFATSGAMPSSVSPPPRDYRQNSISSPPALSYQQRLHDIPTISILSSPSYHQQGQNNMSPPLLSPSRFLWSNNEDTKYHNNSCISQSSTATLPPTRSTIPPSMLTSSYNSNSNYKQETMPITFRETPIIENEPSRYFNNNSHMSKLATSTPSSLNSGAQQLYFQQQQQSSNVLFNNNNQYNDNHTMASPNSNNIITTPKQSTNNKNTSFY